MKNNKFLGAVLAMSSLGLSAAQFEVEESLIVRLKPGTNIQNVLGMSFVQDSEVLIPSMNLYSVKVKKTFSSKEVHQKNMRLALSQLRSLKNVRTVSFDHPVKLREARPNDPQFASLWNMHNANTGADIRAVEAWELSQGGKDLSGNEIVVAVVDGGVDIRHPDLVDNIWINKVEIPGNKVDDDGNGYVDDVNGWNAFNNSGNIPADNHGTHVAGIVGAKGNNGQQVTGVNWNVKIMPVAGASGTFSIVAKAYAYVIAQKKGWIETHGKEGANIVVTNSSFGVDYADCASEQYSMWNDIYNEMGKYGILSAAATANAALDVDVDGDVPTGCDSPFIISVTNTNSQDVKFGQAAWGAHSVGLGAPGTGILSTLRGGGVGSLTGTSMSTPHIAGAVAFLHSTMNETMNLINNFDPAANALALKKIMLDSTDANTSLAGRTVTGGRLNLFKAAQATQAYTN